MAGFLKLVGIVLFGVGVLSVFLMFKGTPATVFVEAIATALLGFGAIIMGLAAIVERMDAMVAAGKKPEGSE